MGKPKPSVESGMMRFLWGRLVWVLRLGRNRNRQRKVKGHLRWGSRQASGHRTEGPPVTLEAQFPVWPVELGSQEKDWKRCAMDSSQDSPGNRITGCL